MFLLFYLYLGPSRGYHARRRKNTICCAFVQPNRTYLEVEYGANAVTDYYYEEQKKLANGTDELDPNYYQVKYQEIE